MRNYCSAGLLLVMLTDPLTPAAAQDRQSKRIEKCSLVVAGTAYIDGPCDFTILDSDGSFQIMAPDNSYFAQVEVDRPGHAKGYWNEEKGANHAHSPLGELTRDDACWSNADASVCAW